VQPRCLAPAWPVFAAEAAPTGTAQALRQARFCKLRVSPTVADAVGL